MGPAVAEAPSPRPTPQQAGPSLTVAEVLLQELSLWGVERIYGVAGDAVLGFLDAVSKQAQVRFIPVKHEFHAGIMASAEAKLTGKVGVCFATMGPGFMNLLNGLADAHLDRTPVVAITGQAPVKQIGGDENQVIDQQVAIQPIARYSSLIVHPDAAVDRMYKALHLARTHGVVTHLSVPSDLFEQSQAQPLRPPVPWIHGQVAFSRDLLEPVLGVMRSCRRPMIVAGEGAWSARPDLPRLAQQWGGGLVTTLGGKGIVDEGFPFHVGGLGEGGSPEVPWLLQESDLILLIGTTYWPEGFVPRQPRVVQVDAAPENLGQRVQVEYGIVADAGAVVALLADALSDHRPDQEWIDRVQAAHRQWKETVERESEFDGNPLPPQRVMGALSAHIPPDAIITVDTGDHTVWFNRNFRSRGQTLLYSGDWRTMGFGLPAALAAKLSQPHRPVVAVVGDGGLAMGLGELTTAVQEGTPITVVLMNNDSLQMEKSKMIMRGYGQAGVDLTNPDFVKVAEASGWRAERVRDATQLESALVESLADPKPTLLDIPVQGVVPPLTGQKPLGSS